MKVKRELKTMLALALAAAGLTAAAGPRVEITEAWQAKPGSGVVDFTYEVKGLGGRYHDLVVKVSAKGCAKTAEFTIEAVTEGMATTNVNYRKLLGGIYPNVMLSASLEDSVQLWEGGPYIAKCNVGAKRPEQYGNYFWWGDTVGYVHNGSQWVSAADGSLSIEFNNETPANTTYNQDDSWLESNGWIGEDGNLVAAHDAATAHLGAPWRMPTKAELAKLQSKCRRETTDNWKGTGVKGVIVTGLTAPYNKKSVFFPAAGYGNGSTLLNSGIDGIFWSSTPYSYDSNDSWMWNGSIPEHGSRCLGLPIRPVR